ncbi:MAG: two-component sensor histidine kinase [Hormoscilla sp. SP5CHS1]|nr:two-component sensor histidine kinase [Hormoscilla sp. SP12CHS1]MBC6453592.1 two-component sensor histidine kinase [Hormoscilla sp. SP5CHS1]
MKFPSIWHPKISQLWVGRSQGLIVRQKLAGPPDPNSLQFRLTVGIAAVSAVGLGSLSLYTSMKMHQQLIYTHKQNIQYVADRFPRDVETYSQQLPLEIGLQHAIDESNTKNLFLWVKTADGNILTKSTILAVDRQEYTALISIDNQQMAPRVNAINDKYMAICSGTLVVQGRKLGHLYVAQDITSDRLRLNSMVGSLLIATILAIALITVAIALYVRRALEPVRQISQHAGAISAADLGKARVQLDCAPSEVRELARTLDIMLYRLSESWEQQRQFVSNVSHELRTPLTIVAGYVQSTLRRGANLTEPQREALATAAGEADRTIQLLQDLLELARADSGHIHFQLEVVMLNDLLSEVVGMARQYSNRQIILSADKGSHEVVADCNRLKQVLLNLIDNAVKYSDPDKPVTVKLDRQGSQVSIAVCDTGCGIPLPDQTRIFERFYRVDETRARATGGTGLGLSIVKTLVEGMGGRVTVLSKLDKGSTFTVWLPAQSAP